MRFILIVSVAGSASTTLQRLIGTIPKSNITGEKYGAIENLLECYRSIKKTYEIAPKDNSGNMLNSIQCEEMKIKPCWLNTFDLERVKSNVRNTIISILNCKNTNHDILGYKDIRWYEKTSLIHEFIELFPDTKIICHVHDDLERQSQTQWLQHSQHSIIYLKKYTNEIIQFCLSQPKDRVILTKKSDIFVMESMQRVFSWIGYDMRQDLYEKIIKDGFEKRKIYSV